MSNPRRPISKEDLAMLEYTIDDYADTACSVSRDKMHALKRILFTHQVDGLQLHEVRGFILNGNLVIFGNATLEEVQWVLFVDRENGRVRIYRGKVGGSGTP